jgi:hypothetical protein
MQAAAQVQNFAKLQFWQIQPENQFILPQSGRQ